MGPPPALTGAAADVPYLALPPHEAPATTPVVLAWHSLEPPDSEVALAAALPMFRLPAWRVYLGLPLHGRRPGADAGPDFVAGVVERAAHELPAALAELAKRMPVHDQPVGLLGVSIGSAVAQLAAAETGLGVEAIALVDPTVPRGDLLIRRRPVPAVLVVVGTDCQESRLEPATELWQTLSTHSDEPERASLVMVPDLRHGFDNVVETDRPSPGAGAVRTDDVLTRWFNRYLGRRPQT